MRIRTLFGAAAGLALLASALGAGPRAASASEAGFTLDQATGFPFVDGLVSARTRDRIAWIRMVHGVRNIFVADGPDFVPRQVTQFTEDDGQELTQLTFSPDGGSLVFVRGGDHDSNWAAKGGLQPNPTSSPVEPKVTLWCADPTGTQPARTLVEGDGPALSATGRLAYLVNGQVWAATLNGKPGERLFFDRGRDSELSWSPDGSRLAFTSDRGDHAFIGVYSADAVTGTGHAVWTSPETLRGSFPDVAGGSNLNWAGNDRLTFLSETDNWPHLYTVAETGGPAKLLTPGAYMVEHLTVSRDGRSLVYSANTGGTKDDDDRRHLFRVSVDGGAPVALTRGESLEWTPVSLGSGVAFVSADAHRPPAVAVLPREGAAPRVLAGQEPPQGFAGARFVTPRQVSWTAPDGLVIHGQLFQTADTAAGAAKPGVIFVHGGPPRQMMLGWSYMRYYSNAYAMNQYLAAHGFVVLSVNYRLGIGYGYDFQHPARGGWAGSSEYQDVLSGALYLGGLPGVDGKRLGIWGGSYGGLLTALGLARNSDVFKAGVDLHGVHDWSRDIGFDESGPPPIRYEKGDLEAALAVAFKASPVADVDRWTSPVLFIHGDDDRNVHVGQTIDLARRLRDRGVPHEELIIPDDIHDFLRDANWRKADAATVEFLARKLGAPKAP